MMSFIGKAEKQPLPDNNSLLSMTITDSYQFEFVISFYNSSITLNS